MEDNKNENIQKELLLSLSTLSRQLAQLTTSFYSLNLNISSLLNQKSSSVQETDQYPLSSSPKNPINETKRSHVRHISLGSPLQFQKKIGKVPPISEDLLNRRASLPSSFIFHTNRSIYLKHENKVKLNVGGQLFQTTYSTLTREPDTFFSALLNGSFTLEKDQNGAIFIDRDPTYFRYILNYLRDGSIRLDGVTQLEELYREARFYQIQGLMFFIEYARKKTVDKKSQESSTVKEYHFLPLVHETDIDQTFQDMVIEKGYDFENWIPVTKKTTKERFVHFIFSKYLTQGEIKLIDRLENET